MYLSIYLCIYLSIYAFCDFSIPSPSVWSTAHATRSCEVLHRSRKIILIVKPEDPMLQSATPLRKSAPGPSTMSDAYAAHAKCIFADPLQTCHACHFFFHRCTKPRRLAHFWQGAESIAPATQNRIRTAKSGPRPSVLALLTPKGASRALFRHLNLQKWSDTDVLLAFWLRNMLRTTTGCPFLNSSATKSVPNLRFFRSWVWSKCASCNNCVHFFQISTPKSAPRLRCFDHFWFQICFAPERRSIFDFFIWADVSAPAALARLLFDPPEPQTLKQHSVSQLFYLFACLSLSGDFFLLTALTTVAAFVHKSAVWLLSLLR